MDNRLNQVSVTPTVARQTPKNEFGNVLKDTLQTGAQVAGSLLGNLPGVPVLSAAVSSVTNLVSGGGTASAASAATGIRTVGGSPGTQGVGGPSFDAGNAGSMGDYMRQMRAEADRSLMMQMQMQQESREYNTVSNVLKTRHDSAKAAINNIR